MYNILFFEIIRSQQNTANLIGVAVSKYLIANRFCIVYFILTGQL